jgi:hypothetical protein
MCRNAQAEVKIYKDLECHTLTANILSDYRMMIDGYQVKGREKFQRRMEKFRRDGEDCRPHGPVLRGYAERADRSLRSGGACSTGAVSLAGSKRGKDIHENSCLPPAYRV